MSIARRTAGSVSRAIRSRKVSISANTDAVSAVVLSRGSCTFLTGPATLNFGAINPTSSLNANASTTIQIRCTGGVRNVTVRRCQFEGTENGIRVKSSRGRGGAVENLVYEDLTMKDVVEAKLREFVAPDLVVEEEKQ